MTSSGNSKLNLLGKSNLEMNEQLFIVVRFANCYVKYSYQWFSTIGFFISLFVLLRRFMGYSPTDTVFVYQLIPRCLPQTLSQNQFYFIFPVVLYHNALMPSRQAQI